MEKTRDFIVYMFERYHEIHLFFFSYMLRFMWLKSFVNGGCMHCIGTRIEHAQRLLIAAECSA
jgi:hypothetical protein